MNWIPDTKWGLTEGSTTPQTHRGGWLNELLGRLPGRIRRLRAGVWAFRVAAIHGRDARATRARGLRGLAGWVWWTGHRYVGCGEFRLESGSGGHAEFRAGCPKQPAGSRFHPEQRRIRRLRAAECAFREAVTHGRDARATRARGLRGLLKEFFDRIRNPCETDVIKVNPAQSRSIKVESAGKRRFNLRPGRQTLSQRGLGHNRRLSRIRSFRSKFGRKRYFFAEVAPVFRAIADGWATGSRGRQINA